MVDCIIGYDFVEAVNSYVCWGFECLLKLEEEDPKKKDTVMYIQCLLIRIKRSFSNFTSEK